MDKKRWDKVRCPIPISKGNPCEPGDVVSHYGGFHTKLVLKVDSNGLPTALLPTNGDEVVIDESLAALDDGTLYHTDRTSTEEEWRRMAPYAHCKGNEVMRRRIWADYLRKESRLAERWAADPVPFRVYRGDKWTTPQELAKAQAQADKLAVEAGFIRAEYLTTWNGYNAYEPIVADDGKVYSIGPALILQKGDECRWAEYDEWERYNTEVGIEEEFENEE